MRLGLAVKAKDERQIKSESYAQKLVSQWENGWTIPTPSLQLVLATVLGCSVSELGLDDLAGSPTLEHQKQRLRELVSDDEWCELLAHVLKKSYEALVVQGFTSEQAAMIVSRYSLLDDHV